MNIEKVKEAIKDIEDFYSEEKLFDLCVNVYVKIWSYDGSHLSSSYYSSLFLAGRNLVHERGKYINNTENIKHQFNYEWKRKFHINDIERIYVKFIYGDEFVEKRYK